MKYIPDIEAAFPNPGNAFRLFGNDNELAETCVGFPSEPMMVTIPPNKTQVRRSQKIIALMISIELFDNSWQLSFWCFD